MLIEFWLWIYTQVKFKVFFNILVDHIFATNVLVNYIKGLNINPEDMVAVSPDMGGANRTRHFAKKLKIFLSQLLTKRRDKHNEAIAANVIGDVEGKVCLMFDDIIDTAGTICEASKLLKSKGAKEIYVGQHTLYSQDQQWKDWVLLYYRMYCYKHYSARYEQNASKY